MKELTKDIYKNIDIGDDLKIKKIEFVKSGGINLLSYIPMKFFTLENTKEVNFILNLIKNRKPVKIIITEVDK